MPSEPAQDEGDTDDEQCQRQIEEAKRWRIGDIDHRIGYCADEGLAKAGTASEWRKRAHLESFVAPTGRWKD